jgi:hypothetical protein
VLVVLSLFVRLEERTDRKENRERGLSESTVITRLDSPASPGFGVLSIFRGGEKAPKQLQSRRLTESDEDTDVDEW